MNYSQYLKEKLINDQISKIEEIFIEALERKGYYFESRHGLEKFVEQNCRCVVNGGQKTYLALGEPFLLLIENTNMRFNRSSTNELTLTADFGEFKFL